MAIPLICPLYLTINAGDINADARRHRWSLWYRTAFVLGMNGISASSHDS
jgi:hypothetical protein